MKKILFVLTALAAVLIGFSACSNGSSDDNGGGGTPSVQQSDLYGAYWGSLEVKASGEVHIKKMCIEIQENSVALHNNVMGFPYYVITFTDNKDGTWLVGCYNTGEDTSQPSKHVRITVDTTKLPFSCKPYVVPMGDFTKFSDCIKGKPYNNEFQF
nr:hypothetical protein [Treponema socranskii]